MNKDVWILKVFTTTGSRLDLPGKDEKEINEIIDFFIAHELIKGEITLTHLVYKKEFNCEVLVYFEEFRHYREEDF